MRRLSHEDVVAIDNIFIDSNLEAYEVIEAIRLAAEAVKQRGKAFRDGLLCCRVPQPLEASK